MKAIAAIIRMFFDSIDGTDEQIRQNLRKGK